MQANWRFARGLRDGVPIGLGYFAVAVALGITARAAGFTPLTAFLASLTNNTSAGEFAAFSLIAAGAGYWEVAMMTLVANARYLLMSCALSQKIDPAAPYFHRFLLGMSVTDEIFGVSIAVPGKLWPSYSYGVFAVATLGWSTGTAVGVLMGNVLPVRLVSALGVGLYGMFLAVIIPPARRERVVAGLIAVSFALSFAASYLPISQSVRTIVLTVVISLGAAVLFPVQEESHAG